MASDGAACPDDFVRAAAYDRVAQTYAGDLLAGADWAWAETPREDLRQRVLDVQVWLGDIRWASGDARGSWQALQRAVEVDPFADGYPVPPLPGQRLVERPPGLDQAPPVSSTPSTTTTDPAEDSRG